MKQEVYCEIVAKTVGLLKKKVRISVDFGEKKGFFKDLTGEPLKDKKTGKTIHFHSIIDALNYLSTEGWLLVHAYQNQDKDGASVMHYLMRKRVTTTKQQTRQIAEAVSESSLDDDDSSSSP